MRHYISNPLHINVPLPLKGLCVEAERGAVISQYLLFYLVLYYSPQMPIDSYIVYNPLVFTVKSIIFFIANQIFMVILVKNANNLSRRSL